MISTIEDNPVTARPSDATHVRILDAAVTLFSRDGYGRTVVESIAVAAGVGNGTVYRRFATKENLFFAALRHCLDSASTYVRHHIEGMTDPIATLRAIARLRAEYCTNHPEMVAMMMIECAEFRTAVYLTHLRGRHGSLNFLTKLLRQAILSAQSTPAITPENAAVAFMDMTFGAAINGHFDKDHESIIERTDRAVEQFLRGLVGETMDQHDAIDSQPIEVVSVGA